MPRRLSTITTTVTIITITTIIIPTITGTAMAGEKRLTPADKQRFVPVDEPALSEAALYRLMIWLSPAYPVGAFSYSSGIEWAVEAGDITSAATLRLWLEAMLTAGSGINDGIFFGQMHRAVTQGDNARLAELAELAAAFVPS